MIWGWRHMRHSRDICLLRLCTILLLTGVLWSHSVALAPCMVAAHRCLKHGIGPYTPRQIHRSCARFSLQVSSTSPGRTTKEMEEEEQEAPETALAALTSIVKEAQKSQHDVVQALQSSGKLQGSQDYVLALRVLRLEKLYSMVLRMYTEMSDEVKGDMAVYTEVLQTHIAMKRWHRVKMTFNDMARRGVKPDLDCFNMLLFALAAMGLGQCHKARALVLQMRKSKVQPNNLSYLYALEACSRKDTFGEQIEIWKLMKSSIVQPMQGCYEVAIRACQRAGDWEKGFDLFREMRSLGFVANEETTARMLRVCMTSLDYESADQFFRKLEAEEDLELTEMHYDIVVDAMERAKAWPQVLSLAARMGARNINPHEITCNTILKACAELGKWEVALRLLGDVASSGTELDAVAYCTVLRACALAGQWGEVLRLHEKIREKEPGMLTSVAIAHVIQSLSEVGRANEAQHMYKEAAASGRLRLWRRGRLDRPSFLDARDIPVQVARIALHVTLDEITEPLVRKGTPPGSAYPAFPSPNLGDLVVVVDENTATNAIEGSVASGVLQVIQERLGQEAQYQRQEFPVECIRIPGSELQALLVKRVQQAMVQFSARNLEAVQFDGGAQIEESAMALQSL